jgi:hypothetical protein
VTSKVAENSELAITFPMKTVLACEYSQAEPSVTQVDRWHIGMSAQPAKTTRDHIAIRVLATDR